MNIDKKEARTLLAISSGRVSAAKQSLADLEAMMNDLSIKLNRAKNEYINAEAAYKAACGILERDE